MQMRMRSPTKVRLVNGYKLLTLDAAIYKALFDARRKLRAALVTQGYIEDDLSRQP